MRENNRKPIEKCRRKLPQFTTMNVIDGQAGLVIYSSLIFYSLTIDNILNIIVLLIFAGVSIAMLTGDNGILTQAQRAKEETEKAQANEASDLANIESLINEYQSNINIPQVTDEKPGELEQEDANTLVINSIEDLVFFSHDVTNKNNYSGKTVKLGVNLDFNSNKSYVNLNSTDYAEYGYNGPIKQALTSGTGFIPIGSQDGTNSFYGTFDGNNKVICSLYINIDSTGIDSEESSRKVFFFSTNYGVVRNLGLVNMNMIIKGIYIDVGGLSGVNYNSIYNSYVTGNINVTAGSWTPVGGLCGVFNGSADIKNSYNLANIVCKNIKKENGGANISCAGIIGQTGDGEINIEKCFNRGNITADGGCNDINVAGICGGANPNNTGEIKNCYNSGRLEGNLLQGRGIIGGIIGQHIGMDVSNSYNSGDIISNIENVKYLDVGGIAGIQDKPISNVFNIGEITIKTNSGEINAGGITGSGAYTATNINNAYNVGTINLENASSGDVGSISGADSGFIALNKCYYLKGTYNIGAPGNSLQGVTELENISDFPSVLEVVNGDGAFEEDNGNVNGGYPVLKMD